MQSVVNYSTFTVIVLKPIEILTSITLETYNKPFIS